MDDLVAETVNDFALLVHHVVVFERAFAGLEVVLLDAFLRGLNGAVEQRVLQLLAFLKADAFHDLHDAIGAEEAHQVVFEGDEKVRGARIALTRAAAAQLAVNAAGLMPLGGQHMQATEVGDAGPELNVRATPCHVRGNGDGAALPGTRDNLGLLLVELGVQHRVDEAGAFQEAGEMLAGFHGHGADQNRAALGMDALDFAEHGLELLALGFVNGVVLVLARTRPVRRDDQHAELVDVEELLRLGFCRAGHAGELQVEAEIILNRDRRVGLRLLLDDGVFLRLDGLVQAIAPAAAGHQAARVLVHDYDFVFLDDILHVLLVKAVGLQELGDDVDALRLGLEGGLHGGLGFQTLVGVLLGAAVNFVKRRDDVRHHEGIRIVGREMLAAFLGQVRLVALFLHREKQLFLLLVKILLGLVEVQVQLGLVHQLDVLRLFQDAG